MNLGIAAVLAYGILAIVGGIFGYVQSQSKVSIISGSISGVLLIGAAIIQLLGQSWGRYLGIAIASALIVVFVLRLVKTQKFMPAGLMIIAGVVTVAAAVLL